MSTKYECDCCGKQEYTDSRSDNDAIADIKIEHRYTGFCHLHLCKECFLRLMKEYFKWDVEEELK